MKHKALLGVLVFALAAALVGDATMAWFTDAEETGPVDFQAGTLMIDVDNPTETGKYQANLDRLNPGDCAEWEFKVKNVGTKSANWLLYMCWQDIIGRDNDKLPEGQQVLLGARDEYGTKGLSEVLEWTIKVGDVERDPVTLGEGPLVVNMPAFAAGGEEQTITVTACLPGRETGNEYQGARMDIYFGAEAWQTTNGAPAFDPAAIECKFAPPGGDDPGNGDIIFKGDYTLSHFSPHPTAVLPNNDPNVTLLSGIIQNLRTTDGILYTGTTNVEFQLKYNDLAGEAAGISYATTVPLTFVDVACSFVHEPDFIRFDNSPYLDLGWGTYSVTVSIDNCTVVFP